jgi:predicted nuclease of predicted toxin-antitoxin system
MIWLDAQLSPRLALWITRNLGAEAWGVRDRDLRDATDERIFAAAREADVVFITKDKDFAEMLKRLGAPPKVIWLRCGNTSEARLKEIFSKHLAEALHLLDSGEILVEIQ